MLDLIDYMTERQAATERRRAGAPRPWSDDVVIAEKKLCSVFRDDDRTSMQARARILSLPESDRMQAAITFRAMNLVASARALHESGATERAKILEVLESLPQVFGTAYRIQLKGGLWNKAGLTDLVLRLRGKARWLRKETPLSVVRQLHEAGAGHFLAYQIMQDLRWVWGAYDDERSWALIGPGALRGIERLRGSYKANELAGRTACEARRHVSFNVKSAALTAEQKAELAPLLNAAIERLGPRVNLFEIEHNLCEWDKYCRVASGETPGARF